MTAPMSTCRLKAAMFLFLRIHIVVFLQDKEGRAKIQRDTKSQSKKRAAPQVHTMELWKVSC